MTEWQFPNAIAESVRRSAELRGQHSNRLEIRDWADKWPDFVSRPAEGQCEQYAGVQGVHSAGRDSFCTRCGVLVQGR